ncbi:hypothetical protein Acr_16g0001570 [Actinidia rufa]|uniref:Retrovirus-related Pol polyprotein from transposon TNT 1-94-like beta-barrel domain-containing protein n=1 Tax=Actinidia rufa TaxID=165716 RepID=A0A7J0FXY2_9ERIC|nr:hypothetical protein Acr_16g0001570 [Actinidia rufa]
MSPSPVAKLQARLAHMECPCESETLELSRTLERIISRVFLSSRRNSSIRPCRKQSPDAPPDPDHRRVRSSLSHAPKRLGMATGRGGAGEAAATPVMAVDESDILLAALADGKLDWVLDLGNAYHLYRDREVFSTYAACEGRVWMANNMATRVVGKGSVRFRMADGRSVTLTEFIRETRRCYREGRLECYTDWRGVSRQGELLSDMGPVVLARRMDKGSNRCTETRKASAGCRMSIEKIKKETKSILRSCTATSEMTPKRVFFALDLISGGDLSSCAHKGGEMKPQQLAKSYGGAGPEAVRMDNLKTSDYPPMGWRGRLLKFSHLVKSKPSNQAQARLAHMDCLCKSETLELFRTLERIISG